MTQDGLFLFLGHKIAIIPKTLRCFCFVQHARGRKKNFFHLIFVVMHFWRYVHFRGRRGAQENLYFRRGDGCVNLAILRMWTTMKTIFYCSTGQKKKFFCLIFVVIHFWRYVDFRGRSGAQENLYFRRGWLRKFSNFTDVINNENYFFLFDRSEKKKMFFV